MKRILINGSLIVAAIAVFVISISTGDRSSISETDTFMAPGLEPMTIEQARENFYRLAPALLGTIYEAFAQTEEDQIYDTLSGVTHGEALEYLYLERAGALSKGGLQEQDQTLHEINLVKALTRRVSGTLTIDAVWQVIGTVGHAEHLHVRGNTYSADLVVAPVDGAWRITGFALTDVNRDTAGETFLAPDAELPKEGEDAPDTAPKVTE